MPRGGRREGAGRKKGTHDQVARVMREKLIEFNERMDAEGRETVDCPLSDKRLMRPEEILLRVANGLPDERGFPITKEQVEAAVALLPYSIAKPASVSIHHVNRTDTRQMTDAELARIAEQGSSGGSGTFAASESPLLPVNVVRNRVARTDRPRVEASETPSLADFGIAEVVGDAER